MYVLVKICVSKESYRKIYSAKNICLDSLNAYSVLIWILAEMPKATLPVL